MNVLELGVAGAYEVTLSRRGDERGWFARMFCQQTLADAGLDPRINQMNNSFSAARGTLRGIHYQEGMAEETKLVRAVGGSAFDVVVDLRPESPTYGKHAAITISAEQRNMLYVPRGCGHAVLTLEDDTELIYMASQAYDPSAERGVRWNEPRLDIPWPLEPVVVSDKDAAWPDFSW